MSFIQRAINVQFRLANGTVNGQSDTLDLTNYRVEAVIDNPGGPVAGFSTLNLRVFGMGLSDMNAFAYTVKSLRGDGVTVSAGNVGGNIRTVFDGTLMSGFIDTSAMPEVSFNVTGFAGGLAKVKPAAPNSYPGSVDVATAIGGLAQQAGFAFVNNGVTAKLRDQYVYGTLIDQITRLAEAAGIQMAVEVGLIAIWPNGAARDAQIVQVSPASGMVGYPVFDDFGITVKTEFDPSHAFGRRAAVTSSIPKASGTWNCYGVRHEISTFATNGPWFTTLKLGNF